MEPHLLPAEPARLAVLRSYDVLDTGPEREFDDLVRAAAQVAGVAVAAVSLVDEHRQWFKATVGTDVEQTSLDESFCRYVVAAEDELHVADARLDPRFADYPRVRADPGLRSYAGFPLRTPSGAVLGSLCVVSTSPGLLDEGRRLVLRVLATQVVTQLELRRHQRHRSAPAEVDLRDRPPGVSVRAEARGPWRRRSDRERVAQALQARLVPAALPRIGFLELAADYRPQSRTQVGGDFYDVFPLGGDAWGVVIGDVMGKGPQAAGRTSAARYGARAAAMYDPAPTAVLRTMNRALLAEPDEGPETPFVTALYARVELRGDEVHVHFASAGHPLPTLLRADGSVREVGAPGTLLGVLDELELVESAVVLAPGDGLVLVTDGVLDSGGAMGQDGLERALRGRPGRSAAAVVDEVQRLVSAAQRDDAVVLALRRPAADAGSDSSAPRS